MLTNHGFKIGCTGVENLNGQPIPIPNTVHEIVGLLMESARVQTKDADRGSNLDCNVNQCGVFNAKTRSDGDTVPKARQCPFQDLLGRRCFELISRYLKL